MKKPLEIDVPANDLCRVIDNILLFVDPKRFAGRALIALGPGVSFMSCDAYCLASDHVGEGGHQRRWEITEDQLDGIIKICRPLKKKAITLWMERAVLTVIDPEGEEFSYELAPVSKDWKALELSFKEPAIDDSLPVAVALRPERLHRLGRIKVSEPAPADFWFKRTERGARAHIKIGPTFQAIIQGVHRPTARDALGDLATACMWPEE